MRSDAFESSSDDLCLEGCCPRGRARFNDDDAARRRATPPPIADDGGKESLSSIFPLLVVVVVAARRRVAGIVRRRRLQRTRSNRRVRCEWEWEWESATRRETSVGEWMYETNKKTYARFRLVSTLVRSRGAASARRTLASTYVFVRVSARRRDDFFRVKKSKASTSRTLFSPSRCDFAIFCDNVAWYL